MGKRRNRTGRTVPGMKSDMASEPCMESVKAYKMRVKEAKDELNALTIMAVKGVFDYEYKDAVVGRAYIKYIQLKQEYARRKSMA